MYSIGAMVTVTKTTSSQRGHVGVVVYATASFVYVFDFMADAPRRWAVGDVKAGGTRPTPTPAPPPPPPAPTSPALFVTGKTLEWGPLVGVTSYVLATKVPGREVAYSKVSGTSFTPPEVPGVTVRYGLRADVDGAPWATEVEITYAAAPPPPVDPPPAPPATSPFEIGLVAGSAIMWELPFVQQSKAPTARMEFAIGASVSSMGPTIEAYARAGIRPLLMAGFARRLPTEAEAANLATWARAFGPGGTFWQGKGYRPSVAVTDIEFGNETSYSYQWSDNSAGTYAARAQTYGQRFAVAAAGVHAANPAVRLLAIGDGMDPKAWIAGAVRGAPALGDLAGGFTLHPYGNLWRSKIDRSVAALGAVGITDLTRRLVVSEWGLSSDDGRALSDNYGWDTAMTYREAAATLRSVLGELRTVYGSRLGAFYLYQAHDLYAPGTRTGREAYFGARKLDGTPKGDYTVAVMEEIAASRVS